MKKIRLIFICALAYIIYSRLCVSIHVPNDNIVSSVVNRVPKGTNTIVFVNFNQSSGEERLFIYNVQTNKFVYSGLCMHGNGGTITDPKCSNKIGSHCSSIGLFKITGKNTITKFKIPCYRLRGLSSTNSNAEKRGIVIHAGLTPTLVPFEVWKSYLPTTIESQGCFTVSLGTMLALNHYIKYNNAYLYAYKN